jgi:hypothetical protein
MEKEKESNWDKKSVNKYRTIVNSIDKLDELSAKMDAHVNRAGVKVSSDEMAAKEDGKHKVTIEFAGRPVDVIKPLAKYLINLVIDNYEINEEEGKTIPFTIEPNQDGTGSTFKFKLLKIKGKEYHHLFVEELMQNIHTRAIFMYFQDIVFANKDITIFQSLDKQLKQVIKENLEMEDTENVLNIDYSTMKNGRTKMSFAIPVFYKEVCDDIHWFNVFKGHELTRNLCQFKGRL